MAMFNSKLLNCQRVYPICSMVLVYLPTKLKVNVDRYSLHELVGGIPNPLKNMSSSIGMMTFPIWENKSHVPVTNKIINRIT